MVRRDADQLRPRVVVAAVDNESMNGANPENCDNAGLNANVHSIGTIRHTAESFADGVNSASTQMILCPARAEFGDREGWTKTTLKAATATIDMTDITLTSEQATELARIKAASSDLLTVSKTRDLQWPEVMKAVWDMKKGGKAPAEFLERAPFMITVQGQNRAAVFIMALADDLGARVKRAGQFGYEDLFPDDGGCGANLAKLKKALMDDNAFLPATICDHLTYRESTEMGRRQHKAEKHSRKTGLYSAVEMGAMIVRQAFCPESNGCKNILREVLGDDWEREWKSSDKDAKRLQAGLAAHIKNDVMDTGTSMYRGAAIETLVYAHGLERHFIVDVIMERLLKEDEAMIAAATSCNDESDDEAQRKKSGKRGCSNFRVEVLAALFGLMEPNQRTPELVQCISDAGIVSGLGELIKQLGRNGIVQRLVRSALERQHLDQPREDDKGIFLDAIPDLVSVEDAAALGAENGNGLREAEQLALKLFVRCFQKGSLLPAQKKKWLTTINKRCLNNYLNSSNQTEVCPGRDKQPVLSVSCTPITFYRRTLLEYEHSEDIRPYKEDESKGRDGRRLSIELTALVVDRVIRRLAEGDDAKQERALDNFKKIVAALDRNGWLFAALSNKPEGLTVGAEALFDSPRQEIINKAVKAWPSEQQAKATGGGSSKKDAAAEDDDQEVDDDDDAAQVDRKRGATGFGSVLLRHGDKVIEISLPPATLQELGLGDEARTDEEEEVSVVLVKRPASDKGLPLTKRAKNGGFKMAGDPPTSSHGPNSEEEAASAGSIGEQGAKPNVVKKGEDFSSEDSDQLSSQGSHQGDHSDFFEDDEFPLDSGSLAAIKNVKDILGECKKQFGIGKSPKEGGSPFPAAKEGVVNDFFKERLPKSCYANLNAAKSIRESANSTTVYAFLPSVVEALGSRLVSKEHVRRMGKYIFKTGEGVGSLRDLVVGTHGTEFPMKEEVAHKVWVETL
ncbi:unnamed protein product [Scytosiphon promiscuus]